MTERVVILTGGYCAVCPPERARKRNYGTFIKASDIAVGRPNKRHTSLSNIELVPMLAAVSQFPTHVPPVRFRRRIVEELPFQFVRSVF